MDWQYEKDRIYSIDENGKLISEVTFSENNTGDLSINRVYVIPEKRGIGVASKTMEKMAQYLRDNNQRAVASCPYANAWLKKNRDNYSDIILDKIFDGAIASRVGLYARYIR